MLDYPLELLARVMGASLRYPEGGTARGPVTGACTDSRKVQAGFLFFALEGERVDGHRFVPQVLAEGAAAAVVRAGYTPPADLAGPLLEVPDPVLALGELGLWHRNRHPVRVVAVTGSVGKTTTKDLVAAVLGQQFRTLKSPGNYNTEIGLPLALLELRPEHEAAVVELSMRGPGQIAYLARLARPEAAIITNIGLSHLELLGSQDAIAAAKGEVLDFLPTRGAAILPADDAYFETLRGRLLPDVRCIAFGEQSRGGEQVSGSYFGPSAPPTGRGTNGALGSRFALHPRGKPTQRAWMPLLGRHNMRNALAAAAAGAALGITWARIARGLAQAEISGMRMETHRLSDGSLILDDAYNASSPEAMFGALEVLREVDGLRRTAVLGSMLELGPASEDAHRRVGEAVAAHPPGFLVTVGEGGRLIAEAAKDAGYSDDRIAVCASNDEAIETLRERRRPGDVILVKGSRGVAMESIVRALREDADA
ncbi:MAG: UDP-N-acetylmuramoyl-tripeptide--D-alanyl-D-alanine ligase [Armatimonadota bacterium]